jgi:hypothetical protein
MNKGFFVSIDLIITIAAVIFLFGFLGVYLHNSISDYAYYKEDAKMQSTMNIALNRLANSDISCDLLGDSGNLLNKKVSFCVDPLKYDNSNMFGDLDYNVSLDCGQYCLDLKPSPNKFIAKEVNLIISESGITKADYFILTNGGSNSETEFADKTLVRVYVWK